MARIVPGIDSPEQHVRPTHGDPEIYRPTGCPHCGKAGLHRHGHYERNVPCGEGLAQQTGLKWVLAGGSLRENSFEVTRRFRHA